MTTFNGPLIISVITRVTISGESSNSGSTDLKRMLAVNKVKTGKVSRVENGPSPLVHCLVCGEHLLRTICVGASKLINILVNAGRTLVLNTTT